MKKHLLLAAVGFFIGISSLFAQAPEKFNYQGVARDAQGQPLAGQAISLQLTIRTGATNGVAQMQETHAVTTNTYGLYNVEVGGGTNVSGSMAAVTWGNGTKYLQVQLDPNGGTNYTNFGATQLLSAPYALYAKEVAPKQVVAFRANGVPTATNSIAYATPLSPLFAQDFDDGGNNYDPTTGEFTAPTDGYYHFDYNLSFTGSSNISTSTNDYIVTSFTVNNLQRSRKLVVADSKDFGSSGSTNLKLSAGDIVKLYIYQNITTTLLLTTGSQENDFSGFKIN